MRMWMIDPKLLCNKQLVGEAAEIHLFLGTLAHGKSVKGYLDKRLVEPKSVYKRHEELVTEMEKRGFKHLSHLNKRKVEELLKSHLTPEEIAITVDRKKSLEDLKRRCIRIDGIDYPQRSDET